MDSARALTQSLGEMFAERSAIVLFVILTGIIVVLAVVYVVYKIKRTDLQSALVMQRPIKLFDMDEEVSVGKSQLPGTLNGQEFSYSFWLYVAELQPSTTPYVIFHRASGAVTATSIQANPIVMVDGKSNKLYICMRTNTSKTTGTSLADVISASSTNPHENWVVATIDYVPMQRWVHVVFVVSDNILSVYMDGDMYTVENVMERVDKTTNRRPIFAGTTGDVVVGRVPGSSDLRGYLAKLQFFNYALTKSDVASIYASGPASRSILASLGLPAYGVRSPLYRVDDA